MRTVHVVLPNDIDDPGSPSGGNHYDRRLCQALTAAGWAVHEHAVSGGWPRPRAAERTNLANVLAALPDDAVVLLDGLVASAVPEVLAPQARRLRLAVLLHMPLDAEDPALGRAERTALAHVAAVIVTSGWTRRHLLDRYALPPARVHVAVPGVDPAPLAPGTRAGTELLCVAAVSRQKGHDVLAAALATVAGLPWRCRCVGSLRRDPEFVDQLRRRLAADRLADRVRLLGPRTGAALATAYAEADLLLLPSRGETYGMVVTEALARGIPVLATAVGGVPEALGHAPDGSRPGLLVPPGDPTALAAALRRWLGDADLRARLRLAAQGRRRTLTDWTVTAARVADVLTALPTTRAHHPHGRPR
ncbi:glycosyltransferase family 4 protein [Micromonospora sp. HM5-17]|uniref:glycosyltransferase family 4 protein n=1 Tax=Micromonospora sp. HM5-17 TaxID=2487710 RepID=UPI000F47D06B|nr:glycosyltransferase family 4 protein [Micromonospora sp. HM5-17]ROT29355.1 glycosyltransferase [Micromonospora sp. HM5-17]